VSAASAALNVVVDTVAPAVPTITSFSPDTNIVGDDITDANQLTLTGTAEAGSEVLIFDGSTQIGTVAADVSGNWSFATGTLADGTHAFTSKAMDAAGNLSVISAPLDVTVDTVAPNAPTIVSGTPAPSDRVLVSGTAEAGSTIKLYEGTTLLGTAVTASNGVWNITTGSLAQGVHVFTATSTDVAGNSSGSSAAFDPVVGTLIESAGATDFTVVGKDYYLSTGGTNVVLKYAGSPVAVGQFGTWSPIGAEVTASGYDVAWKDSVSGLYAVWTTDSNANFVSKILSSVSGTSSSLESIETVFHQDLNGDGVIGVPPVTSTPVSTTPVSTTSVSTTSVPTTSISTTSVEASGTTSLDKLGSNYLLDAIGSSSEEPTLKYAGVAVVAGQFGTWSPVGVEATSSGYNVAWKDSVGGNYSVWTTDSNGNFTSKIIGSVSGADASLKAIEAVFHQDLNGDGVIDTASTVLDISGKVVLSLINMSQPATIEAGAKLELTGAISGAITFKAATGTLVLDHASQFAGKLIGLSGDGTASNSDQIDLKDIAFGSGTTASYSGNTSGGVLTVVDAQDHTAHLSLVGDYTHSTFNLSNDGSGGTLVIDPPMDGFDFGSASTSQPTPVPQAAPAARTVGDSFAFDRAGSSASGADSSLETVNHPAMPQLDSLRSAPPPTDHVEVLHVAISPDAHLAEFHNFMLHH
jgi:Tryptophan-rich Synechocystis species C-terminal domain/Bacterial Ig-like domain